MASLDSNRAVFITAAYTLEPEGGGVQRCTREYIAVAEAAGFTLHYAAYPIDRHLLTRLRRKLRPRPYQDIISRSFIDEAVREIRTAGAGWVFFNQIEAAQIAPALGFLRDEGIKFAMLSHGVDSSDYLHSARTRAEVGRGAPVGRRDALWLGRQIFAEMEQHKHFDQVFCLSETDRAFEQWLGGRSVQVLPRVIERRAFDWAPEAGRLGTVGTLNHAPNLEGLVLFCRALATLNPAVRLRLIGRPDEVGRKLAREFSFVDYLGSLGNDAFAAEARTWCAFVNPVFCYARGCSTKLAVPLGWNLPVASTRAGARGYIWDESLVPLVDTPAQLAQLAASLALPATAKDQRPALATLTRLSPQLGELAARLRIALT